MSNTPTRAQKESSGWTLDDDLTPLAPLRADDEPTPRWWKAVDAHLDEEPFYTEEELAEIKRRAGK